MINLGSFISKWNGRRVDYDKVLGPQCMDLIKEWAGENGWPIPNGGGSNSLGLVNFRNGYTFIKNTITAVPKPGDIMIWNLGPYGHTDVFVYGNVVNATCFSQCYPTSTLVDYAGRVTRLGSPCQMVTHYLYKGCVGWLRKV